MTTATTDSASKDSASKGSASKGSAGNESLRDQLVAEVDLVNERLDALRSRIASESAELRETFTARADAVASRAQELATSTREWMAVRVGTASAVEDLGHAVDAIEVDLEAAEEADADTYRSALDRQLRVWRGRAEGLRLQEALAEMEIREELEDIIDRLRDARGQALVELRRARADAKEIVIDLRDDVEALLRDARRIVERAVDALDRDD